MNPELKLLSERVLLVRGGRGRTVHWPDEIKKECVQLLQGGATVDEVAKATRIAHKTLVKWMKLRAPEFSQLQIKNEVDSSNDMKSFTLTFSSGPRIENLTFEDLKFFKAAGLI